MGASKLVTGPGGLQAANPAKYDRSKQREYAGGHNLGAANVTKALVPPPFPHPKVTTRLGQGHFSQGLVPPDAPRTKDALKATQLGASKLETGVIPPAARFADIKLPSTKLLSESKAKASDDDDEKEECEPHSPNWLHGKGQDPLPPKGLNREFPHSQRFGALYQGEEMHPPHIKANYPALEETHLDEVTAHARTQSGGTSMPQGGRFLCWLLNAGAHRAKPSCRKLSWTCGFCARACFCDAVRLVLSQDGHHLGASHISPMLSVKVVDPPPARRGSYAHGQRMGAESVPRSSARMPTKMGQASIKLG